MLCAHAVFAVDGDLIFLREKLVSRFGHYRVGNSSLYVYFVLHYIVFSMHNRYFDR